MSDLSLKSVADLKKLAKSTGVKGYTKMKKNELVDILSKTSLPVVFEQPSVEKSITDLSVKELKELAKNKGIQKYYQLTKPQLIAALGIVPQTSSVANVQEKYTYEQLVSKGVKQLKDIAKESGVKSYYKMNKDDLIKSIMEKSTSLFEEPPQSIFRESVVRPIIEEQVVEVPISPENIYQPELEQQLEFQPEPVMIIGEPLVPEITETSERGYKYIDDILKEIQLSDTDKYMKDVNAKIMKCLGIY